MKTLRHPNILVYLDGVEVRFSFYLNFDLFLVCFQSDKAVYVVTEKAVSLDIYLNELKTKNNNETNFNSEHLLEIAWGLQQLCVRKKWNIKNKIDFLKFQRVLIFLHDDCKLSHGNINTNTVFVDAKSCDWKLACLEFVQSVNEEQTNLPSRYLPACQRL